MKRCTCWNFGRFLNKTKCPIHPTKVDFELQYIADSPARDKGGFHPLVVKAAKDALKLIRKLRRARAANL